MNVLVLLILLILVAERLWKYVLIRRFFQKFDHSTRHLPSTDQPLPLVSVLQPILSGDPTLWNCLTTNVQRHSSYPVEFLWLVDTDDVDGINGCRALIQELSLDNVRLLLFPPPPDDTNPKMFKLIQGLVHATGDIVAVLDDDTILPDNAWEQCVPTLDEDMAGLAFGLPYYRHFANLWSALISAFVNSQSLFVYVPYTHFIQPFTINGMFYVLKRTTLDQIGGFDGLEHQLCDDYAIAERVRNAGLTLVQTPLRHAIRTHVESLPAYTRLLTRWFIFPQVSIMQTTRRRELLFFYLFAMTPSFVPAFLVIATLIFPSPTLISGTTLYLSVQLLFLWDLNRQYLDRATPLAWLPAVLLMQLLLPLHICWALLAPRRIDWRGHVMAVDTDGGFHFVKRRTHS